jgi:hypothetical protein
MQLTKVTCVALLLMFTVLASHAQERPAPASPQFASAEGANITPGYGNVPLVFEANQGQTDSRVKFLSQGKGYSVFLTSGSMVLSLRPTELTHALETPALPASGGSEKGRSAVRQLEKAARAQKVGATTLAINLVGGSTNPQVVGEGILPTKVNYFIGRDPKKWHTNVLTYARIRYRNVYPGIDLVYYGNHRSLEYDFDLAPGADPTQIQFEAKGADALNLDSAGNLLLTKGTSQLRLRPPVLYQETKGTRAQVPGTYVLHDRTHVGFEVGKYDATKALVIDPVLVYSTFLGGSGDDFSNGIAVDATGDAYVVGLTDSVDFPLATIGSYSPTQFRMFLTKLDATGSTLLFADYFGGTSGGDEASSVAVDSLGSPYVTGCATSSDFPVTAGAYQSTRAGSQDAFLAKFSPDGSSIIYSTYLGGSNLTNIGGSTTQTGYSVSVDAAGEAVIAGVTMATDFPMKNPSQSSASTDQFGDWGEYGFVTKFSASGASLVYSTYLSGATLSTSASYCTACFPDSEVLGVVTDSSGNAYVTGYTSTTDFPVTAGAITTSYPGDSLSTVGFVSKFSSSGAMAYSTYLGGLTFSFLDAIAVDSTGSAYVTGYDSANDNFPIVTTSICDPSAAACNGTIIAKLNPTGSSLLYSTFLGTSNNMVGQAIQVDANGDAFIVGSDVQFDLSNPIEGYAGGGGDVVVAEIDPSATTVLMATFLGGQGWEAASGLALDSNGAAYVTGETQSLDFPVTESAFQTMWGGQIDAFVSKIDPTTNAPALAMAPFSLQFGSQNIGSTSAAQTTILRNMGSAALTISGTATGADFGETDDCGATVAPASFCTFTLTFTPTASGNLTEGLTITDDASGGPHSVTLAGTGVGPSFTISGGSNAATVSAGGTVTYELNVSPTEGSFSNAVTFACNGAPAFATCTVNPQSIIPGSKSSTVIVTVRTDGAIAEMHAPSGRRNWLLASWIFAQMGIFGVLVCGANARRKFQTYVAASMIIMLLFLAGCSGTSAAARQSNTTAPGTYSLSVVAISGALQHNTQLTLIVN